MIYVGYKLFEMVQFFAYPVGYIKFLITKCRSTWVIVSILASLIHNKIRQTALNLTQ